MCKLPNTLSLRLFYFGGSPTFRPAKSLVLFLLFFSFTIFVQSQIFQKGVTYSRDFLMFTFQNDKGLFFYSKKTKSLTQFQTTGLLVKKIIPKFNDSGFFLLLKSGEFILFDCTSESATVLADSITDFVNSKSKIFLSNENGEVLELNADDLSLNKKIAIGSGSITALCMNHKETELAIATREGHIGLMNTRNYKIKKSSSIYSGEIISICFNENDNLMFAGTGILIHAFNRQLKCVSLISDYEFSNIEFIKENIFYLQRQQFGQAKTDQISRYFDKRRAINSNESQNPLCFQKNQISTWALEKENNTLSVKFYNYSNDIEVMHHAGELESYQNCGDSLRINLTNVKKANLNCNRRMYSFLSNTKLKLVHKTFSLSPKTSFKENELEVIPQIGFAGPLKYLYFFDNGQKIITMAESPVIKVWSAKTMELIREIRLPEFNVMTSALHPKIPLLVVLDRNYQLHLIDLASLQIIKSMFYTKEQYNYEGDYHGRMEFDINMEFKFDGALLSIHSNKGSILENQKLYPVNLNARTADLITGNIKPIILNEDEIYTQQEWNKRPVILSSTQKLTKYFAANTTSYAFYQETDENTTKYFLKYLPTGKVIEIQDSVFFSDSLFHSPFYPSTSSFLPETLYKKLSAPLISYRNTLLIKTSPDKKYQLVKGEDEIVSVFNSISSTPVFYNSGDQVEFLDEKTGVMLIKDTIFFASSGKKENLKKHYGEFRFGKGEKNFKGNIQYYYERQNDLVFLWTASLDNRWIIIDVKTESISVKQFPRPELAKVKPSIFPAHSYLNYQTYFSRFDPFRLKTDDYWIQTKNVNDDSVSFSILDKKPEKSDSTYFYLRQPSFENNDYSSSSNPTSYYSLLDYLEVVSKSGDRKPNRILINPLRKSANKLNCHKDDEYCLEETYYCSYTCTPRINTPDSLSRIGFLAPKLNSTQKAAFEKNTGLFQGFARNHGKIGEYDFLSNYGIPIERNGMDLYSCEDFIDSTLVATSDKRFALSFYNRLNGEKIKTFLPPPMGSYFMHFLLQHEKVLTYGYDGGIRLYDFKSSGDRETYTFYKSGYNHIFITPDHFYKLGGNSNNLIRFRKNGKVYNIEQFDLKLNRPDILLKRAGSKDSLLIESYHRAYLKRLKKMGFTEDMLKDDYQLPEIIVLPENNIPNETNEEKIKLDLNFIDKKHLLDRVNVYVNGVPVYGLKGISLRKESIKNIRKNIEVPLSNGRNHIEISVLNQAGAESYKERWTIDKKSKQEERSVLYLITIGAGKYLDARFDLKYATKDAEDISKYFAEQKGKVFKEVKSIILKDESVTRQEINSLRKILMNTNINDVVIVTFAGHGVLNNKLDYYLATYDMNFANPEENGLAYEELENLLDGIPPLRKLLIIDACHSGEVDKEEVELVAMHQNNSEITFRSAGAGIQERKMGMKSTTELVSELFTDLRKGTGSTIISSSGGTEVSMESDQWKNGLFTYCLLNGLKSGDADLDKDGNIRISELQSYLVDEVAKKSAGTQKPSSRITNAQQDFRIK